MINSINSTCLPEKVYKKYTVSSDEKYIEISDNSKFKEIVPFDMFDKIISDYLYIGYAYTNGFKVTDLVLDFISSYGMPDRKSKKVNIESFADGAESLYLHFSEISENPYPENPDWILETDPMSGIIKNENGQIFLEWQTESLLNAIEILYTILLTGENKKLGFCKHCGKPFFAKNPKSEFCSAPCRNKFNVYKCRSKKK